MKIICLCAVIGIVYGIYIGVMNMSESMNQYEIEMNKGINIGNALDSPKDEDWGVDVELEYFDLIKDWGFDTVRLPVRFSDYVDENNVLDETFMQEIDSYVDYALDLGLVVILDLHHFNEIMEDPDAYLDTYVSIWEQLSERYQDYPNELVFELLNEPQGTMSSDDWNEILNIGIEIIRDTNENRNIIIDTYFYSSIDTLNELELPNDDYLIVSVHYYEPIEFTFQGNIYHEGFEYLSGITWTGTTEEISYLEERFQSVADWAAENQVDIFLGEFGVNDMVPDEYRAVWISAVTDMAEKYEFSWAYWEMASAFGFYDASTGVVNEAVLNALIN